LRLTLEQRARLGELLMQNPGAFFIPRSSIRRFARSWRRWVIERRHGAKLKLQPETDPQEFERQLHGLLSQDAWRSVGTA
jgi:hypothetical protein